VGEVLESSRELNCFRTICAGIQPTMYTAPVFRSKLSDSEIRLMLKRWFKFYNSQRPHQGLENMTPDEVYLGGCPEAEAGDDDILFRPQH